MIDWQRIAVLLTEKWLANGKLPTIKDNLEYNFIFATNFTGFPGDVLRFAREEFYQEPTDIGVLHHPCIKIHGKIDRKEAICEVWALLTEDEKTAIMADTLGGHVLDR